MDPTSAVELQLPKFIKKTFPLLSVSSTLQPSYPFDSKEEVFVTPQSDGEGYTQLSNIDTFKELVKDFGEVVTEVPDDLPMDIAGSESREALVFRTSNKRDSEYDYDMGLEVDYGPEDVAEARDSGYGAPQESYGSPHQQSYESPHQESYGSHDSGYQDTGYKVGSHLMPSHRPIPRSSQRSPGPMDTQHLISSVRNLVRLCT